jgi:hypothetical protein
MDLLDEMIQRNIRLEKSVNILERHKEESQILINREVLYQKYICQFSDAYLSGNELYKRVGDSYIDWYKKYYLSDSKKYLKYIGIINFVLNNERTTRDF